MDETSSPSFCSFAVNLRCGDAKDSDIALHFKPQFEPSEVVVLNSFQDGQWGEEERPAEMPFQQGESFELVFHVTPEDYKVRRIHVFVCVSVCVIAPMHAMPLLPRNITPWN